MKDLFRGYNKKTEKELKVLWENAIFVFDTNVLLNLYRYSEDTRNSIINLVENFKDRVALPYHTAYEFNKNRYEVIAQNEIIITNFLNELNKLKNIINSKNQQPFLSSKLNKEADEVFKNIESELNDNKQKLNNFFKNDPIFDKINLIFSNKVSKQFTDEEIKEISKEGEIRYANKIPPGFEDSKKQDNKFGDLILWKHIIEIANENKNSIILISDEQKKDWFWILEKGGKTIGPHPKLIEEFYCETGFDFHILSSERFLKFGEIFSSVKPSPDAIEEIETSKKPISNYSAIENFIKEGAFNQYINTATNPISNMINTTGYSGYDPTKTLGGLTSNFAATNPISNMINTTGYSGYDPTKTLGGLTNNFAATNPISNMINATGYLGYDPTKTLGGLTSDFAATNPISNMINATGYLGYDPTKTLGGLTSNFAATNPISNISALTSSTKEQLNNIYSPHQAPYNNSKEENS